MQGLHHGRRPDHGGIRAYCVRGGIASLAAAAFMIREADVPGHVITILEAEDRLGGSLDGAGDPERGYVIRGGRMLEAEFRCTFDLFSSIPTLARDRTVTEEILAWNRVIRSQSKARLVRAGRRLDTPAFGLAERHILTLERLGLEPEGMLGRSSIADHFEASFFETNFWLMWCTTFAFQPWHSAVEFRRYLLRFMHLIGGFSRLEGILRTRYNQYDSLVRPLQAWLAERGVRVEHRTRVTDLEFAEAGQARRIAAILCEGPGGPRRIEVGAEDRVLVTLGSMTDASSFGDTDHAPAPRERTEGAAWRLWERIADGRPEFGRPVVFDRHVPDSRWVSFTATLRDPALFRMVRDFTGNVPGEGGLITFAESGWLLSIVLPHQPHFADQPEEVQVLWGYGLKVDRPGDAVAKPMLACTGREIMQEVLAQLGLGGEAAERILATTTCIPCLMPFITSQFLCRGPGDRPAVRPEGAANFAFLGQFCELPEDVVFTVEYSVRSAWTAVQALFGAGRVPPPVHQGRFDPRVLWRAFRTLHDLEG
ncbi:oleate hydratase [Paracraurococcus lichenis]|uniref:Oleate hydratase n=1 Tax=Paracraurococcus lichenis TaxID=3064888 RepID=A0ABT9DVT3_9PROT|nr:oleate hydratase [Paracraurococcus sp. LOR1-02]MDO9708002.1 oleate hydratase [Paracraurococcus sp. LOR1-02]